MDLNRLLVVILMVVGMLTPMAASMPPQGYVFVDPMCERIVREALEKPDGPIFREDLANVTCFVNYGLVPPPAGGAEVYPLSDLSILRDLPNLEILYLWETGNVDFSPLLENSTLTELYLYNAVEPVDFSTLPADLPLRHVSLYDVEALHLEAILSNPSLEVFSYHTKEEHASDPISIDPLCETDALQVLW